MYFKPKNLIDPHRSSSVPATTFLPYLYFRCVCDLMTLKRRHDLLTLTFNPLTLNLVTRYLVSLPLNLMTDDYLVPLYNISCGRAHAPCHLTRERGQK